MEMMSVILYIATIHTSKRARAHTHRNIITATNTTITPPNRPNACVCMYGEQKGMPNKYTIIHIWYDTHDVHWAVEQIPKYPLSIFNESAFSFAWVRCLLARLALAPFSIAFDFNLTVPCCSVWIRHPLLCFARLFQLCFGKCYCLSHSFTFFLWLLSM